MFTRSTRHRLTAAGAGLAAAVCLAAGPAVAAPTDAAPTHADRAGAGHRADARTTTRPLAAAAGWLSTQLEDGRHLPAPDGDHIDYTYGSTVYPDPGQNADIVFGLAAAHTGRAAIGRAMAYLAANVDAYTGIGTTSGPYDGAVAKVALAAIVTRRDPQHVGGAHLLAVLRRDECPAASTSCTPGSAANIYSSISESFVLLAEARGGLTPTAAAQHYFASLQCADGGFTVGTTACGSGAADVDATAYALMALRAVGGHPVIARRAATWLRAQQRAGGWWSSHGVANVNSTGLAAAALAPRGVDVSGARAWLRSQQVRAGRPGAGALRFGGSFTASTPDAASPSVLATAQALTGLARGGSLAAVRTGPATRVRFLAPVARAAHRRIAAAGRVTLTGTGFAAGERVRVTLAARPAHTLGSAVAGADAVVQLRLSARAVGAGRHVLRLHGTSSGLHADVTITVAS